MFNQLKLSSCFHHQSCNGRLTDWSSTLFHGGVYYTATIKMPESVSRMLLMIFSKHSTVNNSYNLDTYILVCYFSYIQVSPLFYLGIAKNREMKESPQISGWSRWSWDFWVFHPRDSWDFEGYTQIFFGRAQKEALDWMLNSLKLGRLGWYTYITYIHIYILHMYIYILHMYILYICI